MKLKLKGPHMQFFLKYRPNYSNNSQLEPNNKLTQINYFLFIFLLKTRYPYEGTNPTVH